MKKESIPTKIRKNLNLIVDTHPDTEHTIPDEEVKKVLDLVEKYRSSVFDENKVGKMKIKPIHLDFEEEFKPTQPKFHNTPIHYRERLSKLLKFLRAQKVMTDVDPRKSYGCIMNVVITDKKNSDDIRMNVDATPINPGMRRSRSMWKHHKK